MIYFCTKQYLESTLPISANADVNDYMFNVKSMADMYTRSILGTYFYNDLLTKYNAQTMSADELTLLEYIQPAIAWKAAAESVITLSYQLKNKGVQTQSGDFSNAAEYKDLMFLVHHYSDKGDFYLNRLSTYLQDNKSLYPVFLNVLNTDSTAKKSCGGDNLFNTNIMFI